MEGGGRGGGRKRGRGTEGKVSDREGEECSIWPPVFGRNPALCK